MSFVGLLPIAFLWEAVEFQWRGIPEAVTCRRNDAISVGMFEVVLEAWPQFLLQFFIAGSENRFDGWQLLSIASSLATLTLGLLKGVMAYVTQGA